MRPVVDYRASPGKSVVGKVPAVLQPITHEVVIDDVVVDDVLGDETALVAFRVHHVPAGPMPVPVPVPATTVPVPPPTIPVPPPTIPIAVVMTGVVRVSAV